MVDGFGEEKEVVLLDCCCTAVPQQHDYQVLYFASSIDIGLDLDCPILQPFCALLKEYPELSENARTAKEWAVLLRPHVSKTWKRPVGSGAVGRYFSRDRQRLEERLVIVRTPNPVATGYVWQLALRKSGIDEDGAN